jgi:hypothetical protein
MILVDLFVVYLNASPRPTRGHSMSTCGHAQLPPSICYIIYNGGGILETPLTMIRPPQMTTHQPTPQNQRVYIPIDISWCQDSEYLCIIYVSIDTPKSCDNCRLLINYHPVLFLSFRTGIVCLRVWGLYLVYWCFFAGSVKHILKYGNLSAR